MWVIIISVISRLLYLVAVLGFTFGLVLGLHNPWYLWCLALLVFVDCIPKYELRRTLNNGQEQENNEEQEEEG